MNNNGPTQFQEFSSALSDLYLRSPRISELLCTFEARPSTEAWQSVKTLARGNEEKLIKLYNFIESLPSNPDFDTIPQLDSEIRTIVQIESVRFYAAMRCYPEASIPTNPGCIHELVEHARRIDQKSGEKTLEFQNAVRASVHRGDENCSPAPGISNERREQ